MNPTSSTDRKAYLIAKAKAAGEIIYLDPADPAYQEHIAQVTEDEFDAVLEDLQMSGYIVLI